MNAFLRAENLCIEFPIYENSHRSLKNAAMHVGSGGRIGHNANEHPVVRAVDNASFQFTHGDRVGLIGHNGSGKTTLLRALTGVYEPVSGTLASEGRIASLLDVSMGLDPDATGYENIYLRGILDGLTKANIRNRVEEIADFSELGDFLGLPVRTYSSGMMLRLAFAISTSVDADILLMDEWLSVGDADFSAKAEVRLQRLLERASILVIASHDFGLIDRVCNRRIFMKKGVMELDEPLPQSAAPPEEANGQTSDIPAA
jgi:lipopolysaccharide transport system ATP-binding protein